MKRLLAASVVAVSLHLLLFQLSPGWLERKAFTFQQDRTLALSLSYIEPERSEGEPIPPPLPVTPKRKTEVVKKKIKEVRAPEERPQEKVQEIRDRPERTEIKKGPASIHPSSPQVISSSVADDTLDFSSAEFETGAKAQEIQGEAEEPIKEKFGSAKDPPGLHKTVITAIDKDAMPLYKVNPKPHYPRVARRRGYEGTVVLLVYVTCEGKVGEIGVDKSSGYPVLDAGALSSVKEWLFEPAIKRGNKVGMWVKVPVTFKLR